ncbi:MAG: DNA helicase RecQ [Desulfobacca sp.]|nr:DNA helicase RecQ [Desulfobacca sp.]
MPSPESLLKNTFGYGTFKPLQREVIANVLDRRDTLAIMPTGGGKSLCYQIPALLFEGLTVVVSPLIALMKDQVEQLRALGVPALFLNSSLTNGEYQENMDLVARGAIKLLYVAPETLLTPRLFQLLSTLRLDCLTIDEAHCISEWGHDFRPEYRHLKEVRRRYPHAVCLALTATATPRVRLDIKSSLNFASSNELVAGFNRENLFIEVIPKHDPASQTLRFLERFKDQSGIIYCFSRKQVDELSSFLTGQGFSTRPYHAGLDDQARRRNQESFIRDDTQIIVATIAFGMGINKPNVRFVIHYDLPKSIEGYYQEIGRAGRDGLPAHCLLLYSFSDAAKLRYFIDQKEATEQQVAMEHLETLIRFAESEACRRHPLLTYFGEVYTVENCGACDNCTADKKEPVDITILAQKFLSCVKRTGERFGTAYIVDVLLGSKNKKVLQNSHEALSTHGIGKELTREQWLTISRQLVQKGLLDQEPAYHTLRLTAKGLEALQTKEKIMGLFQKDERTAASTPKTGEIEHDKTLFTILRHKRKELADDSGVPPYVIFSDRTLVEMAAFMPLSIDSLLRINGVGQVKAERYGEIFLQLLRTYGQDNGLEEKKENTSPEKDDSAPRYILVAEAFNQGESIESLMKRYRIQVTTILDHLGRYILAGKTLKNVASLLALSSLLPDRHQAVFKAFDDLGAEYLKPVFDQLNGTINYHELKILRLVYLDRNR